MKGKEVESDILQEEVHHAGAPDRRRNRAIVNGFRLKPVPEGRAYQLWFIKEQPTLPILLPASLERS